MQADSLTDLLRPLAWVALAGFSLGFCGYLALHGALGPAFVG
jgi:hypothetical protein